MSFIVLANSTRVVLPLRTRLETPGRMPVLAGLLVSQAKASGHAMQSFIEAGEPGLPRPFQGDRWRYEWRGDGDGLLACWLGFPNVFFAGGIDPNVRMAIEAIGRFQGDGEPQCLARIDITVKAGLELVPGPDSAPWILEDGPRPYPAT